MRKYNIALSDIKSLNLVGLASNLSKNWNKVALALVCQLRHFANSPRKCLLKVRSVRGVMIGLHLQ